MQIGEQLTELSDFGAVLMVTDLHFLDGVAQFDQVLEFLVVANGIDKLIIQTDGFAGRGHGATLFVRHGVGHALFYKTTYLLLADGLHC